MNKGTKIVFIVTVIAITQQVWGASSISTRVKVVEEKIKMHDKKLRELTAQQELTAKQVASLKAVRETAEKAVAEKAEAAKLASIASAKVAAVKAKQRREIAAAKQVDATSLEETDVRPRYAFP
jgi:hypothetical protein